MRGEFSTRVTPREYQAWKLLAEGETTKTAAASMGLNSKTVEIFRTNLFRKIGARNVADATRLAVEEGIIAVRAGKV